MVFVLFKSLVACIGITAGAVLIVAGVAVATHDAHTMHACAHKTTGALRLVADGEQCHAQEVAVSWNQQGPAGPAGPPGPPGPPGAAVTCGDGTRYFVGVCIDDTVRAPANLREANDDCADEAGRLPTSAELHAFARQPGVVIDGAGEWSSDMGDNPGTFRFLVFTQNGNGLREYFDPGPYRCVTAPVK